MQTSTRASAYQRDGYLPGIRIHDHETVSGYRTAFDAIEEREGRERCRIGLIDLHFTEHFVRELAVAPAILDVIEELIGPDILLLATHFFCKYGPEEHFVAWHQDVTYWGLEPPEAVTAWYAIDPSTRENGCMQVIPGSHRVLKPHGTSAQSGNLLSINQEVELSKEDAAGAVDMKLDAGEISVHDGRLIHGSLPNRSHLRRCGLTLRYVAPSVRQVGDNSYDSKWNAILVRGEDRFGNFG